MGTYRTSPKKWSKWLNTSEQATHLQQQEEKKISIAATTESSTAKTEGAVAETNKKQFPKRAVYQKPPKVPTDLEVNCPTLYHSGTHVPSQSAI